MYLQMDKKTNGQPNSHVDGLTDGPLDIWTHPLLEVLCSKFFLATLKHIPDKHFVGASDPATQKSPNGQIYSDGFDSICPPGQKYPGEQGPDSLSRAGFPQ